MTSKRGERLPPAEAARRGSHGLGRCSCHPAPDRGDGRRIDAAYNRLARLLANAGRAELDQIRGRESVHLSSTACRRSLMPTLMPTGATLDGTRRTRQLVSKMMRIGLFEAIFRTSRY